MTHCMISYEFLIERIKISAKYIETADSILFLKYFFLSYLFIHSYFLEK